MNISELQHFGAERMSILTKYTTPIAKRWFRCNWSYWNSQHIPPDYLRGNKKVSSMLITSWSLWPHKKNKPINLFFIFQITPLFLHVVVKCKGCVRVVSIRDWFRVLRGFFQGKFYRDCARFVFTFYTSWWLVDCYLCYEVWYEVNESFRRIYIHILEGCWFIICCMQNP